MAELINDIIETDEGWEWRTDDCRVLVPYEFYKWVGGRPQYRFSFWFKDVQVVSHTDDHDAPFCFSPPPMRDYPEDLIEAAADYICMSPGDTDDDFFDHYNLVQAMWCSSFECEQFDSERMNRFEPEL